jgi:dethiobiotin synthetase
MKYRNIYVAASSQHVGKTTSTLGLVSAFIKKGLTLGYCKPVGQKFLDLNNLRVDKDTLLFADLIHFDIKPELHSPVILGKGATAHFLENPGKFDLKKRITKAAEKLEGNNDLVIYEGTGHPGVGSVADLSNAEVAKTLNAGVIMIVPGGIGNTIDTLNMSLALFREKNVPIIGVIVNKVLESKREKVRKYVGIKLKQWDLPLLGLLPYDKSLAFPVMKTVAKAIDGEVAYNEDQLDNRVEDIIAGSLIELKELKSFQGLLLVVSTKSLSNAIKKISSLTRLMNKTDSPLAGVVATGEGVIDEDCEAYLNQHQIPLVRTQLDTYGSVLKISRIEVKINRSTPWKVKRAIELIEENVNLDMILEQSKIH